MFLSLSDLGELHVPVRRSTAMALGALMLVAAGIGLGESSALAPGKPDAGNGPIAASAAVTAPAAARTLPAGARDARIGPAVSQPPVPIALDGPWYSQQDPAMSGSARAGARAGRRRTGRR
jgi:hypothetical protein